MGNENIVDVNYEDSESKYHTLDDVVKETGLSEDKISFYCVKLNDFLNIQSLGMYQIFSSTDIDNLNRIKNLEINKGLNIAQIKQHLIDNKQEILLKKEDEKIDVSFLDFFAKILDVQDKKIDQMISINKQLIDTINENNKSNAILLSNSNEIQEQIKDMVADSIDKGLSEIDNKLDKFIDDVKEELKPKDRDIELMDKLHKILEDKQNKQNEVTEKKSWFARLFNM